MAPSKPVLALRALVLVASGVFIFGNPFLVQVLGVRSRWLRSWQVRRVMRKEPLYGAACTRLSEGHHTRLCAVLVRRCSTRMCGVRAAK